MTGAPGQAIDAARRVVAVCDVLASLIPSGVDDFAEDVRTQWAVEMGLIRIGEAINRIPTGVLEQPWRTVTRDVPRLRDYLVDRVIPELGG